MVTAENVVLVDSNETAVKNSAAGSILTSESFDQIIPAIRTPITANSGGTQLQNIPCGKLWIRNGSGNQLMFIGGVNENAPYSGRGLSMYGGETVILPVKNANIVSVMANHSGEYIEYLGFLAGNSPTISLSGIYIAPDTTPPTVITVSPASGASGSVTSTPISATFSEEMNDTTITTSSFIVRLSGSSTPLSGSVVCITDPTSGCLATFTPSSGIIQTSKVYNAYLGTSITDIGGNALQASGLWSWTTQAAPFLVSVQPTSGGSGIATNADITATFSQIMASGTITPAAFTVRSGATSTVNLSGVTFLNSSDPTQAVFIPYSGIIQTSGTYFARLATSITDVYGNPLNASGVWSWTTAAGPPPPDTTPPQVSGTTPVSGASGVLSTSDVIVNLSEQVQSGTVTPTNLFLRISGNTWSGAVTLAGDLKTATINPTVNMLNNSTYSINVLSGVKDLAGNFLSPYLSGKQFTTLPLAFRTLPLSGATSVAINTDVTVLYSGYTIASGSVNTDTMVLQLSGTTIAGTASLDSDLEEARLNLTSTLLYSQTYYLYVSGIQDINGNYVPPISGLSFATEDAAYNTVYNVAADKTNTINNNIFRIGSRVQNTSPLLTKKIQKVKVTLSRSTALASGASGIAILLRRSSDGGVEYFGTLNPALIPPLAPTDYFFTNTAILHEIAVNDRIEVQWLSGTSTAGLTVSLANGNAFVGTIGTSYGGMTYSGSAYLTEADELAGTWYSIN